jgi:lipid II:glycine glycyltransferase (peptidoglycan interpeptide bridge formation enzyme)
LTPLGFALTRRLEFELDLTKDEKTLWDAMDVKRRQRIKKAKKSAVEVRELEGREGATHLRRLQEASFERITARGGPTLDRVGDDENDSILAFTKTGVGRVVGGFVDGACVSAGFFTTFNGLAYYAVSGHDARGLETQAPSLMLWETLLRLQTEGFTRLNLGGCGVDATVEGSPEHGVYSYKKAFGGTTLECATGEKVLRPRVRKMAELLRGVVR